MCLVSGVSHDTAPRNDRHRDVREWREQSNLDRMISGVTFPYVHLKTTRATRYESMQQLSSPPM